MAQANETVEAKKKTLTSTVKENPLASISIAAISSALVTFLSQTYATTGYVQRQRAEMVQYFDDKTRILDAKSEVNRANIESLGVKLDRMDTKLDGIRDDVHTIAKRR